MLLLTALVACVDDPCANLEGPRLWVFGSGSEARLEGHDARTFGSLSDALEAAEDGTNVCVAPGVYRETLTLEGHGVGVYGAGPDLVVIEPLACLEDPRNDDTPLVRVTGAGSTVSGMTIRGGGIGVQLDADAGGVLRDLVVVENRLGIVSDDPHELRLQDVEVERNSEQGVRLTARGLEPPTIQVVGGRIAGNGHPDNSTVGGLSAEHDLYLEDVLLRDNAGASGSDVWTTGGISGTGLTLERPVLETPDVPRLRAGNGLELSASTLHVLGSPAAEVSCTDGQLVLENVAIADNASGVVPDLVHTNNCGGRVVHTTLVSMGEGTQGSALAFEGSGTVEVVNTAFGGFEVAVGTNAHRGTLSTEGTFDGGLADIALMRPLASATDLRPQEDSPLVDAGVSTSLTVDLDGHDRSQGSAPDIGAYEH